MLSARSPHRYCFGPDTGPLPTRKNEDGAAPLARQELRAAVACVFASATFSLLVPCGTVTVQQSCAVLPEPSSVFATIR